MSRLRQQRDQLRSRGADLFDRGMRDLDEVDGVRSQEQALLDEQQAIGDAQSLGATGVLDWSTILTGSDFDFSVASPLFVDGTAGGDAERPSGA